MPYFLGVDCSRDYVGIYRGFPDNPKERIWKERTSPSPGPSPTPAPPPPTPSSCEPYYLGLKDNEYIRDGSVFRSPNDNSILLEQWNNGNLAIRDGSNVIWESGQYKETADYWTKLQGDANLITWRGNPPNQKDSRIWKSNSPTASADYWLGLDCRKEKVAIYRGTPDNYDGSTVWESPTY